MIIHLPNFLKYRQKTDLALENSGIFELVCKCNEYTNEDIMYQVWMTPLDAASRTTASR